MSDASFLSSQTHTSQVASRAAIAQVGVSVIIPAAGSGTRFGAALPKQYLDLCGLPILIRTLRVFEQTPCIHAIVIAASEDFHEHIQMLCHTHSITKLAAICAGGSERQHSIFNALNTAPILDSEIVLVHDAVRPFCTPEFITSLAEAARERGSAIPGRVPKETVKEISADSRVRSTPPRQHLRAIQTPQAFRRELLHSAYAFAEKQGFIGTDDASVVEFAGNTVFVVDGLEENIKITTPFDFAVARMLLETPSSPPSYY